MNQRTPAFCCFSAPFTFSAEDLKSKLVDRLLYFYSTIKALANYQLADNQRLTIGRLPINTKSTKT